MQERSRDLGRSWAGQKGEQTKETEQEWNKIE